MNVYLTDPRAEKATGNKRGCLALLALAGLLWLAMPAFASRRPPVVHHRLEVTIDPSAGRLEVTDELWPVDPKKGVEFLLHEGLRPRLLTPGARLSGGERLRTSVPARRWRVELPETAASLRLRYRGEIRHPPREGELHATPGTLSSQGVELSPATLWYPWIADRLVTFQMRLSLPRGWHGISQGRSGDDDRTWREDRPQEGIHLVAGPYRRYRRRFGELTAMAWLHQADARLAGRYLAATGKYLDLYSRLIGPYPYAKFALVENFWESGYGMPSFTLLGPTILRLPFILRSSYPHEILHNWWGNSVYVDLRSGNWSEGLTSYLADHLLKERQGLGADYRRDVLLRYANWVKESDDQPLVRFHGRHDEASQAAGYGRMLMLAHMLRLRLGDAPFLQGLRRFYRRNRFRIADFDDLRSAFEAVSGERLKGFFDQWTKRTGAPALKLEKVRVERTKKGYRLHGRLIQTQKEPPFRLRVPLYVQLRDEPQAESHALEMAGRRLDFVLELKKRPVRLRVDPLYDLFRRLDPAETPPSLSALFSADSVAVVLPAEAPPPLRRAYRLLAEAWQARNPRTRILDDDTLRQLPPQGAVWIFGEENRFAGRLWNSKEKTVAGSAGRMRLPKGFQPDDGGSLVVATRIRRPLGLLVLGRPEQARSLARRLPHYGKYGYLWFDAEGRNRLKGGWPTSGGALEVPLAPQAPPLRISDHPSLLEQLGGDIRLTEPSHPPAGQPQRHRQAEGGEQQQPD